MKYILLTYLDEKAWVALEESERKRIMGEGIPHAQQMRAEGKFLGVRRCTRQPRRLLLARDGKRVIVDGPFAETREQLGGYVVIEAQDMEEAIRMSVGFLGTASPARVEIRPLGEFEDMPATWLS